MPVLSTPTQRLEKFKAAYPEVTQLAEALSLAVRLEAALIRDVRLALWPGSKATMEADFFFSPFVDQRTPDWICMAAELTSELQSSFSTAISQDARALKRAELVRTAIDRAHRAAPAEIRLEEEVVWISVRLEGGTEKAARSIDEKLRTLLMRMLAGTTESIAVARWFASAGTRMPDLAARTEAFNLMAFAASSLLGGRPIEAEMKADTKTFDTLSRFLPASVKRLSVWAALTTKGLHLRASAAAGYREIQLPLTSPILLDFRVGSDRQLFQFMPGNDAFAPLSNVDLVRIRTLTRDQFTFRAKAVTTQQSAGTTAGTTAQTSDRAVMLVSYSHEDRQWLEEIRTYLEAGPAVLEFQFRDDTQIEVGERWEDKLRERIQTDAYSKATIAMVLVSPTYLSSEFLMRGEIPQLIDASRRRGLRLTWICLSPCDWEKTPLVQFQALLDPSVPLSSMEVDRRRKSLQELSGRLATMAGRPAPQTAPPQRVGVYISYRRDDNVGYAGRLYDNLVSRLGRDLVIRDIENQFLLSSVDEASRRVAASAVVVAVIDRDWTSVANKRSGKASDDFVRQELMTAFQQNIPVIPVLVGGGYMPASRDLPPEIASLVTRNAVELRDSTWNRDVNTLVEALQRWVTAPVAPQSESQTGVPQIYISSTYQDLVRERQAVSDAAAAVGVRVIRMEDFVASSERPLEGTLRDVEASDAVVLILGRQYGYVPSDEPLNPERLSITELEFRHARRMNKPVLAFILQDPPNAKVASRRDREVERFSQAVMKESTVGFFSNPRELTTRFTEAIALQFPQLRRAPTQTSRPPIEVFISVAQQDEPWCRAFQQELKNEMELRLGREMRIFKKSELLPNGYEGPLRNHVEAASVFIAIFSPDYVRTEESRREMDWFGERPDSEQRLIRVFRSPLTSTLPGLSRVRMEWRMFSEREGGPRELAPYSKEYRDTIRQIAGAAVDILRLPPDVPRSSEAV